MFFKYNVETGRITKVKDNNPKELSKLKHPYVPLWVLPKSKDVIEAEEKLSKKTGEKYKPIEVSETSVFRKGGRLSMVQISYDARFVRDVKTALRKVKSDKELSEKLKIVSSKVLIKNDADYAKKKEKELKKKLVELGINSFTSGSSWGVVALQNGKLKITYPRFLKRNDAVAELLINDELLESLVKEAKELHGKVLVEFGKNFPLFDDGVVFFRGEYWNIYYKKSQRASVKIDEKHKRIIISGKTVTEAKKKLIEFAHKNVISEAKNVMKIVMGEFPRNVRIDVAENIPKNVFGRTKVRVHPLTRSVIDFSLEFKPELFFFSDEERIHIYIHELSHIKYYVDYPYRAMLNFESHDERFYEILNGLLKKYFPKIYRKEVKVLGHPVKSIKDENKFLTVYRAHNESIRNLKPKRM